MNLRSNIVSNRRTVQDSANSIEPEKEPKIK